ncbi:FmdB family zinc ribbon protein [Paraburkholderia sp. MPAMCS5]|uniref:FmdB family zinc ribbon protein n=1 Tax=Paraburkholderia sp. MPAMCS5 TaxID=3112563 RepID=UPI002E18FA26|nr:FmdB family zinc ribbon protein [Paraburkholderia sp. MPAMCS5]
MPIYAYRCESCGFGKDVLQKMSDAQLTQCPECGNDTFRKQLTAAGFQLKGSGWYVTDFRGGNNGNNGNGSATAPANGGPNGGSNAGSGDNASAAGNGVAKSDTASSAAAAPATPAATPAPAAAPSGSGGV